MKIEIRNRYTNDVIFSHECEENSVAVTLKAAVKARADLCLADLCLADLSGANLREADLGEAGKLVGKRPYFSVGPIGSREDVLQSFLTEKGIFLMTGCFFGSIEEFKEKLEKEHGDNVHFREYSTVLPIVLAHHAMWPATEKN